VFWQCDLNGKKNKCDLTAKSFVGSCKIHCCRSKKKTMASLAAAVDESNELLPGVQASKETLQPLWEYLIQMAATEERIHDLSDAKCGILVGIHERTQEYPGIIHVRVLGPIEPAARLRCVIGMKSWPACIDNLAEALAWGKHVAKRVRDKDFCELCCCDGEAPIKNLRARSLPFCARCSMDVSLGAPAVKRRRGE